MRDILGLPIKWLARYYYTILIVWLTLTMSSCGLRFGDYHAWEKDYKQKCIRK